MKAICVDEKRNLQLRDVPAPSEAAAGYVTVQIGAAAINHGDKTFLKLPDAAGGMRGTRLHNIWGASAAGIVLEIGEGVPPHYLGRKVAIYRSLQPEKPFIGTWCEIAQLPYLACLPLPDDAEVSDYSGSLVNVATAYAFVEKAVAEGYRGIVITAGNSATGRALAVLAKRRGIATISIVRSEKSRAGLVRNGGENVLVSDDPDFMSSFENVARELDATAVFDGLGGMFIGALLSALPMRSTIFFYGFLSGIENVAFNSSIFMMKDLTMKRFSNFDSATVRDQQHLAAMLRDLENSIDTRSFRTSIGRKFELSEFDAAMTYAGGGRAILVPQAQNTG
jgi:NADPH:quinone reductase